MAEVKIAIIGAGMAGIQVLGTYLKSKKKEFKIKIFDKKEQAGFGMPFIPDDESLLLNQPKREMSLTEEEEHYEKWLSKNYPKEVKERFTTRKRFGQYSQQLFQQYLKDIRVEYCATLIKEIHLKEQKFILKDEAEQQYTFDVVHLCFGQMPYGDPYKLKGIEGFYGNPYPLSEIKEELLQSNNIAIIGSGLSAIDFFIFLHAHHYKKEIYFLCDGLQFPLIRGESLDMELPKIDKVFAQKEIRLKQIICAIKEEIEALNINVEKILPKERRHSLKELKFQRKHIQEVALFEYLILKYHDNYPSVWNQFTLEEQQTFTEKYLDKLQLIKSPMPMESAEKLIQAIENNQAKIVNKVDKIEKKQKYFHITKGNEIIKVERILNATGPVYQPKDKAHEADILPVIENLLEQRILQYYNNNCFQVKFPEMSVISQRHGVLQNLKLHGQTVAGINLANNDVGLIGEAAREAATEVMKRFRLA